MVRKSSHSSSSCSYVPVATILPPSMTAMVSAIFIASVFWDTNTAVRPSRADEMPFLTMFSVCASSADVGSSRMKTGESL